MSTDFYLGGGDTLPVASTTIEDETGPIDLTNASSVTFHGKKAGAGTLIGGAATIALLQSTTGKGQVSYTWQASDSLVFGKYWVQWVAIINGLIVTAPNNGSDELWINPKWGGQ